MRSNKRPNRFSPLAIRLFTRYLLSLAALFAAVVGGYFFAAFVCYRFTWSENDPLYYLLKVVEQLSPVLIVLLLLAGFVWFTVRALRQPLGYLDDVIACIKSCGIRAVTYMPTRNTPEQLARLRRLCDENGLFQVSGEDINSPRQSFVIKAMENPLFSNLIDATWKLIEHEKTGSAIC